ncbi:Fused isobutyryl-CoA mutase [Kurthia zopfii]|uniref:Fused isobutyryl-CoA mutase n=1 Tax=Kurthia zopfii TaxID=1650 RepID=A0A2U3ACQ2_9BACL|nr:fused isobutyryl-CoA mutase/GTPase IcmF [Kurthia zopfii]PWI22338.1 methylmalonyl-CoA mutase [Kurthia zopfii]TDR38301.1 methylmalonyl-CoA mutase [Kurthia zopfii]STX08660.1 Methylmalonyl-CoA mutase [Kurthia zopfii]VEI05127.1 Methylmalonyl-CoA mutase [Kurthia zopfii]GEK30622.1 Fused isobutyryl-CoA mutase [Kurthia zopfii]
MVTMKKTAHPVRFVTASSLFDGHDASINIMRRILQAQGAEVIHLGHNRSVEEVVNAAIQEDAQGIAISSYQGGHVEYFKYMYDLLAERGAPHIKIWGGGGGVILPAEIKDLQAYGISGLFSPEDGRKLGLDGMIAKMIEDSRVEVNKVDESHLLDDVTTTTPPLLAKLISYAENGASEAFLQAAKERSKNTTVLGITGTGGAGKSSLTDELIRRFLSEFPDKKLAVLSIDPTKQKTGGALLGDRIRMNSIFNERIYMRSLATRESHTELSHAIQDVLDVVKVAGFDLIIIETSGIGQGDNAITTISDLSMYVMTSEFGAPTQLEKIDMIDYADLIVINKFERKGSEDALRQVQKQFQRSHLRFDEPIDRMPVYGTIASQFNDKGTNSLFAALVHTINDKTGEEWTSSYEEFVKTQKQNVIIPNDRRYYLREISEAVRNYHKSSAEQVELARKLFTLHGAIDAVKTAGEEEALPLLEKLAKDTEDRMNIEAKTILRNWEQLKKDYAGDEYVTKVRDKEIRTILRTPSLSGTKIPKVALPKYKDYGEILSFVFRENVPGSFPFTAGVFPFKREGEDPKRQFAGEGTPERTNRRFHYVSKDDDAKRLSTAFDSVTLYGEDPAERPDIYGKVGESGVSICTLEDMKKLYDGFDLCAPTTSVSMTINGPAPIILAMFMNTAIDQQVKKREEELGRTLTVEEFLETKKLTLNVVRGTVQADILKEDQGQNTCIFSTEFALRMMGDIQQYFIDEKVRNYYSVSISGYHIAEAGANPISQLAFTLANGFTYVEYYLSRGMNIDDFAPNLSFFFSNGLDPEYTVIGRVARRIWATTMRDKYGANERSQKLKYHVQTSGRSLHAQEIDFNDIRTTLQALMALQDNCNSLHTNAYDEAITTPTEESVRRAMAIQMIITKEHGLSKNENPLQGSFIIEELTDLVEAAILEEFDRIDDRGGVLGAMETQYQRGKIQEESMYYEHLKHSGELPIIGVNTYLNPNAADDQADSMEVARATQEEKQLQLTNLRKFHDAHKSEVDEQIKRLKEVAKTGGNIFEQLMETVQYASLGQITNALYEVGGQYRRNM